MGSPITLGKRFVLIAGMVGAIGSGGGTAAAETPSKEHGSPLPKAWTTGAYVELTEAVVHGFINPRGHRTAYRFQWGLTKRYGNIAPKYIEETFVRNRDYEVEEALSGLEEGTTYHYRIVAYSRGEKVFGGDRTFTTRRYGAQPSTSR